MALTVNVPWTPPSDLSGAFSGAVYEFALVLPDSSYPTGGYAVTPGTFKLTTKILAFVPSPSNVGTSNYLPVYDPTAGSLRLFNMVSGAWTEVAAATDLSTTQINLAVFGW